MTTDQLRDALAYPDDDTTVVDLTQVVRRAGTISRRRRLVAVAAGATLTVAALVAAAALARGPAHDVVVVPATGTAVQPDAEMPVLPPAPITLTPSPPVPTMPVADGVHVDMGHGWDVWLDRDTVCRSEPVDAAAPGGPRYQPFGCRSLTDGNIGGINVQSEISPTGSMLSGLLPQRAARIAVRLDGTTLDASLVRFRDRPGWTFWYAWLPGDGTDARVTAYDDAGGVLDRTG